MVKIKETKYIHYCWFGNKKMSKLGQKCIKSWKKYFPDYKIIEWNESNIDLNECNFIKQAYDNKKWAFVADYIRTKALKEYGGLYFDTDMKVTKYDETLFNCNTFLGMEDTGYVAVGVWYEKYKNAYLPSKLLEQYQKIDKIDINTISELSIPKLITKILDKDGLEFGSRKIQYLNHNIIIYPRTYFYPYSYDFQNNLFTNKTCMIHYYDASWLPLKEKLEIKLIRRFGRQPVTKTIYIILTIKYKTIKILKIILFPIVLYRRKKWQINAKYTERIQNTINEINKNKNKSYIVLHNSNWLGVTSATKELFENTIDCGELLQTCDINKIGNTILDSKIKQVIFSSFCVGDYKLVKYLKNKNPNIIIKSYWHGNNSQVIDSYGWNRNIEIIKLHEKKDIDVMGTCKKSLINFYKKENFKYQFISNKVTTDIKPLSVDSKKIVIGIYAANCEDWRKNMYSQIAAVSLIENAVIDMVPLNKPAKKIAEILGVKIEGLENSISRDELIKRMSKNTVNLYVTFSECSPMLPLESLEMNVPCITGNNHHYFQNNELKNYLIVYDEENPEEIKKSILKCIKNKNKIIKLYSIFKTENVKESRDEINSFLK
jgi:hypothetical protein